MSIRTASKRIADTLHRLETDVDIWLATASVEGIPHLVPLSLGWDGTSILVFTLTNSPTTRNVRSTGVARAALDGTMDVVIIEATAIVVPLEEVAVDLVDRFTERCGWDPREESAEYSLLSVSPLRVLAWNGVQELKGRLIMKGGLWES